MTVRAVLFDFSGTLFRLEEDDSWFDGMAADLASNRSFQAELMHRMTAPTGQAVQMDPDAYHAWVNRDLAPHLHREAYLHVLRSSGLSTGHAERLYQLMITPSQWTPYPDTAETLSALSARGVGTAVVSNIAFDVRPAFAGIGARGFVDEFVLSFEVGAVKPDPVIFGTALERLRVEPGDAVMVGDSEEADGGARALGCDFALVDPLPTRQRPDGLLRALREHGMAL